MKTVCFPVITQTQTKFVFKYENTPIVIVNYSTLSFQYENKICEKIKMFYEKFNDKYDKWISDHFQNYAIHDYISDTNPRKAFRYRPFVLNYNMSYEKINNRYLGIEIQVKLTKDQKMIGDRQLNHIWDLSCGCLQIKRNKKSSKHKKRK